MVTGNEYIGVFGTGTFTQDDGTNSVAGLIVGGNASSATGTGTYNLNGGSLTAGFESLGIGGGFASFNQSGGVNKVAGAFDIDAGAGGVSTYSLSGGSLSVFVEETIGVSGQAQFEQTGGSNSVQGAFALGSNLGADGSYQLSGTGSSLMVTGNEY